MLRFLLMASCEHLLIGGVHLGLMNDGRIERLSQVQGRTMIERAGCCRSLWVLRIGFPVCCVPL